MQELVQQLEKENVGKVWLNEPLKNHTSWKIGGPADVLVQPDDQDSLIRTMRMIFKRGLPYRVIGRGSNILVRDNGIRGVVVKLGKGLDDLHVGDGLVTVGAGYSMVKLAAMIARQGLTGLEFAGGIPGTVGGAVYMNAGAHGSDVSRVLQSAEVLFEDGELASLNNADFQFAYRTSLLQKERKGVCLQATFQLRKAERAQIKQEMARHKEYRRRTQPLQDACCGSVFRNPQPHSAGGLIEEEGLKGYKLGGAQVSTKHANFIVNTGEATANDVLDLIRHIQNTILERKGIRMKTEVQVIGEA